MDDRILKIDLDSVIMWLQQHVSNEENLLWVVYTNAGMIPPANIALDWNP